MFIFGKLAILLVGNEFYEEVSRILDSSMFEGFSILMWNWLLLELFEFN